MTTPLATAVLDLNKYGLEALVSALLADGRTVVGPTVRDGAIVLAELESADQLPHGWGGVELEAGRYRLHHSEDGAAFAHSAGPQSWKNYLHPQREKLRSADRTRRGEVTIRAERPQPPSYAFLGVRPCDLRAIAIQDRVLTGGHFTDTGYGERRGSAFPVAVGCTAPGATCFCTATEEVADLTGDHAERWQRWDSCFDLDFSHLHGGPVRSSASRPVAPMPPWMPCARGPKPKAPSAYGSGTPFRVRAAGWACAPSSATGGRSTYWSASDCRASADRRQQGEREGLLGPTGPGTPMPPHGRIVAGRHQREGHR
ncbi:4Fe-4S dicluster domain-containing protein [Streptomyces sp. NBC_00237]|uniref:4Fe-4S dicluster domain-containing protein n=1 Tax=Streptomyces sp. NBC_00237 TaxID=2975687 RepID=UPI00225A5BCA|nr:4Fe-4S dicluster domain-containing protein [Streptomyces sp. NBC_00237]MCX5205617.1 4Fe-4S dicluster domain-containing protein [Streptomyces sp. NBC_00237]